jgi:hypothetical protein
MVCNKCQKLIKGTSLATPEVKKKSELYYGSLASTKGAGASKSTTLGQTGVVKVCVCVHAQALWMPDLSMLMIHPPSEQAPLQIRQEPLRAVL